MSTTKIVILGIIVAIIIMIVCFKFQVGGLIWDECFPKKNIESDGIVKKAYAILQNVSNRVNGVNTYSHENIPRATVRLYKD